MERKAMMWTLAVFALVASSAARAEEREPPVAVNVEGLQPRVAAEVSKHAEQGIRALNRYLVHTSRQHGLALADVIKSPGEPVAHRAAQSPKEYRNYARISR